MSSWSGKKEQPTHIMTFVSGGVWCFMHCSACLLTTDTTSMFASTLMPLLCFQRMGRLRSVTFDSTTDDPELLSAQVEDPYDAHLSASFVPSTAQRMTEQETVRKSVQERQPHQQQVAPPTLSWPPSGATPINEFNTEGYISCAFPTLFPTGAADFVAP